MNADIARKGYKRYRQIHHCQRKTLNHEIFMLLTIRSATNEIALIYINAEAPLVVNIFDTFKNEMSNLFQQNCKLYVNLHWYFTDS